MRWFVTTDFIASAWIVKRAERGRSVLNYFGCARCWTCSAIASASSTSIPRCHAVLSILRWPKRS